MWRIIVCNIFVNLTDRTIVQLRFGPMVHCSKWYEDKVCSDNVNCLSIYRHNNDTDTMYTDHCTPFGARHQADLNQCY